MCTAINAAAAFAVTANDRRLVAAVGRSAEVLNFLLLQHRQDNIRSGNICALRVHWLRHPCQYRYCSLHHATTCNNISNNIASIAVIATALVANMRRVHSFSVFMAVRFIDSA